MLDNITMSIQNGVCLCGHIVFRISSRGCALPLIRGCPSSNSQVANNAWLWTDSNRVVPGCCCSKWSFWTWNR
uniref:Uncharacterized protein n=1 Tax=Arundo donax TaxID=35708 RepID=A0A0A9EEB1_ARUDO